jgi:hypothetical protein
MGLQPIPADSAETTQMPSTDNPVEETPPSDTPVEETPPSDSSDPIAVEDVPISDAPSIFDAPVSEEPTVTDKPSKVSSGEIDTNLSMGSEDIIFEGPISTSPQDEDLTERILQDLEKKTMPKAQKVINNYVPPPNYEFLGRGLVYNCAGKHWACVDGPSYQTCEDNISSVKLFNRKIECYPFNVYESNRGCTSIQNRMVSSSAKTDFCNEN